MASLEIEGHIGKRGSGKSYMLTKRVLKKWKKYEAVYANYQIDVPNFVPLLDPSQLIGLRASGPRKQILIVIDEAHIWFPSRQSMKLPISMMSLLSQSRHYGWVIWWAAQHEMRVDKALRDITDWMWLCRSYCKGLCIDPNRPVFMFAKVYEPENFRKPKKHEYWVLSLFRSKVAHAYSTNDSVASSSHLAEVKDFFRDGKAAN